MGQEPKQIQGRIAGENSPDLNPRREPTYPSRQILLAQATPKAPESRYQITVHADMNTYLPLLSSSNSRYFFQGINPEDTQQYVAHVSGAKEDNAALIESILKVKPSENNEAVKAERGRLQAFLKSGSRMDQADVYSFYVNGKVGLALLGATVSAVALKAANSSQPVEALFIVSTREKYAAKLNYVKDIGKLDLSWVTRQTILLPFTGSDFKPVVNKLLSSGKLLPGAEFSSVIDEKDRHTSVTLITLKPNPKQKAEIIKSAKESQEVYINWLQQESKRQIEKDAKQQRGNKGNPIKKD